MAARKKPSKTRSINLTPQKEDAGATALRPLLSASNAAEIRKYAEHQGASPTSVVNIALRQWLDQQGR